MLLLWGQAWFTGPFGPVLREGPLQREGVHTGGIGTRRAA